MRPPLDHNILHHRLKNLRGPCAGRPEFHHDERGVFCRASEHPRGFGGRAGGVAAEISRPWEWQFRGGVVMVEARLRGVEPFDFSMGTGEIVVGTVDTPADVVEEGFLACVEGVGVAGVGR